jgi:hypothetical protein
LGQESETWSAAADELENQNTEISESNVCDFLKTSSSNSVFTESAFSDNCIEDVELDNTLIIGMNEYLLQGNHKEDMSVENMNDAIDSHNAMISAFECTKKKSFDAKLSECDQQFKYKTAVLLRYYSQNTNFLRLDEQNQEGEDSESGNDNHEHAFGNLYFYDTEGDTKRVHSDAENNYQDQKVEYEMWDGNIEGRFTWNNLDEVEHTLWVENEDTGEDRETTSSASKIMVPPSSGGEEWSTSEGGFYHLSDDCTAFTVAVLPPGWDGTESDVSYDAVQTQRFTFCPDSRGQGGEGEESVSQEAGGYTFELTPKPEQLTISTDESEADDVSIKVEGDEMDSKRVRLELNEGSLLNPGIHTTEECSGPSCSATITSDRIDSMPKSIDVELQRQVRGQVGLEWRPFESVSWDVE